jgi:hypothetical protein
MYEHEHLTRRAFLERAAMVAGMSGLSKFTVVPARLAESRAVIDRELDALAHANAWLNSTPLRPADLHGKVVLVQFWTFTCINWMRTLPYVRAW